MKITHNPAAFEHLKNENLKLQKAAAQSAQNAQNLSESEELDSENQAKEIKRSNAQMRELASKNIELIKRANADIGRLQILKNSLENLTKNFLAKNASNSQRAIKDELEKLMKNASFEKKSVFDCDFKGTKGAILMSSARSILQGAKDKNELEKKIKELNEQIEKTLISLLDDVLQSAQEIEDEALQGRDKLDLSNIENLMKSECFKECYWQMDSAIVRRLTAQG